MQSLESPRRRRRRDQRTPNPKPMQLTDRDKQIIKAIYDFRILRGDQIQALYFGTKTATNSRLAKLYDNHYLERYFLPARGGFMSSPILYGLDKKGVELLKTLGYDKVTWYPTNKVLTDYFLAHSSAINDVLIAVTLAARQSGYELTAFLSESELKADYDYVDLLTRAGLRKFPVIPDLYFSLITPRGRAHFFVECDMATMDIGRFQRKVKAYIAYKTSGGIEKRYKAQTVRVLTITVGEKRLANLKRATEQADGGNWFWFAVLSQLDVEHVLSAPVWQVAGREDYQPLIPAT